MFNPRCSAAVAVLLASPALLAQGPKNPDFGPNVIIFDSSVPEATIEAQLTAISKEDQFSANRHAVFFRPGAYNIQAPVGYYEQIAGLGALPGDVQITGFITPNFGVPVYGTPTWPQANLTDTFWRSMENLTINAVTDTLQNAAPNTLQWGVSQGAPLRRMQINGDLELVNSYCGNASGGFMSDLVVTGNVNPCSQQQWYTRNSDLGSWNGGVWNMVFSGTVGAPGQSYPTPIPYTTVDYTPVSREKPFLYLDLNGKYSVFAPAVQRNSRGTSWSTGTEAGRSIPIKQFLIAQPSTPIATINAALDAGKNLILTPGVYKLRDSINIARPNTVVLGLGYATLVPQTGKPALDVADVDGVQIAGLIVDAGPVNSPVLARMGAPLFGQPLPIGGLLAHAKNPSVINDMTLRIAGATAGTATTALEVNSADVILDDIWAWRADHGQGVGWTVNLSQHGLVVNGDRVTATGLAVEHFQREQVLWNGNGGEDIFYQSELPYDPPNQAAWLDGTANGYPSYVVSPSVNTHTAYGLGIYSFFDPTRNGGNNIVEDNAMTVPTKPGIAIRDVGTVWLSGNGSITHVIDGVGAAVNASFADKLSPVVAFP